MMPVTTPNGYEPDWSQPLWSSTATSPPDLSSFAGLFDSGQRFDTVIVGAGVTGCSTALHLAQAGARVCALDRFAPGAGTSGRANGQVMAAMHVSPAHIVAAHGSDLGERMVAFAGAAPDLVFDLIARHQIPCEAVRAGWIEATSRKGDLKSMAKLVALWNARGGPVELLGHRETGRLTGSGAYVGAWLDRRGGSVQPSSYTNGLASAALAAGAEIRGGVEVRRIVRDAGGWRVMTSAGELAASTVVLATNAYTGRLVARLARSMIHAHGVQVATEPLRPEIRRTILPMGHACSDGHKRFVRLDNAGRLIIGGPGWLTPPRGPRALSFRFVEKSLRSIFPQLAEVPLTHRWYTRGAASLDLLPHLHEPAPGIFAGVGYAGRGIAMGTAFGTLLARRAMGEPAGALPFPTTRLGVLPFNLEPAARSWFALAARRLSRRD